MEIIETKTQLNLCLFTWYQLFSDPQFIAGVRGELRSIHIVFKPDPV
jgi:hypothetical protein